MSPALTLDITLPTPRHLVLRLSDHHARHIDAYDLHLPPAGPLPTDPKHLLGPIAAHLAAGIKNRTLLIRLPDHPLATSLAAVSWELPFRDRNLVVRIALSPAGTADHAPAPDASIAPEPNNPLRVLLVFTDAPASRPLAARLERERLLDLFFQDILPTWDIEIDVLAHGVTRARLIEQVRDRGGYHIVHWSGHGQGGALQIASDDGASAAPDYLSGEELRALFGDAGGFMPALIFLSACHSASTSTALSLLAAGVKQIVAMRGEVRDTYARRLARRFYRSLLAETAHHPADAALNFARRELARDPQRAADYQGSDHAMPVVFGAATVRFEPRRRRSKQMDRRLPKPQPLLSDDRRDLDKPAAFVGRGEALAKLSRAWLGPNGTPSALVLGSAGIGKTALAAEAVHLWFGRFDHVLCFQAKVSPLSIDAFLQRVDQQLERASVAYRERCADNEMVRVYLSPAALAADMRHEAMRDNLVDALTAERVLIVLDAFEANLFSALSADGHSARDAAWDQLLATLAERLTGTRSRLLITSRVVPATLPASRAVHVSLGLLPRDEAALFFEADPALRALSRDADLAERLRSAARGHPGILARFAEIARKETLEAAAQVALEDEIERLATTGDDPFP